MLDTDGDIDLDGLMLFSLFVGVVAFTLLYVWLVLHRSRTMAMEDLLEDQGLDEALAARGRGGDVVIVALLAMEDAGFVIGSYVITFAVVGALAWRIVRRGASWRRASTTPTSTGPGAMTIQCVPRPRHLPPAQLLAGRSRARSLASRRASMTDLSPHPARRRRFRGHLAGGGCRSSCSASCSSPAA